MRKEDERDAFVESNPPPRRHRPHGDGQSVPRAGSAGRFDGGGAPHVRRGHGQCQGNIRVLLRDTSRDRSSPPSVEGASPSLGRSLITGASSTSSRGSIRRRAACPHLARCEGNHPYRGRRRLRLAEVENHRRNEGVRRTSGAGNPRGQVQVRRNLRDDDRNNSEVARPRTTARERYLVQPVRL